MDKDRLRAILESHGRWLNGEGGEKADLHGADLRGAILYGANLCRANLYRADLRQANLCGANLRGVDMEGTDLRGANMEGADLYEADLHGANMKGIHLSEKIIQVGPIGSRRDYTIYWVDRDIVQCGCWNDYDGGSLDEFKKRVNKTYPEENEDTLQYRNEYLAAIAMFERLRDDARQSL